MIFPIKTLTCLVLISSLSIFSSPATAACQRPFLEEAHLSDRGLSAGLALPIASGLFSYEPCESQSETLSCLFSASIDNQEKPKTSLSLYSVAEGSSEIASASTGTFIGTRIASTASGGEITASQIKLSDARIARIDTATGAGRKYMLFVEHPVYDGYPQIEVLQAFLRQAVIVCGEEGQ